MKHIIVIMLTLILVHKADANSKDVSLAEVLGMVRAYHPRIQQELQILNQANANIQSKLGKFDTKLKFQGNFSVNGPYSGDYYKGTIEQPFPIGGLTAFGGYRQSIDTFPVYEGDLVTLDGGEMFAGLDWSLMEFFALDSRRLEVIKAEWMKNIQTENTKMSILYMQEIAAKAFFAWKAALNIKDVYQRLFDLASQRQKALEDRANHGDIAKFYVLENRRYILERKRQLIEASQNVAVFQNAMRVFLRNSDGSMFLTESAQLKPHSENENVAIVPLLNKDIILRQYPKLRAIDSKREIIFREIRNLRVNRFPNIRMGAVYKEDFGTGPSTLMGSEVDVHGMLEFPIQNREAKAAVVKAESKLKELKYEYQLEKDTLELSIDQLDIKMPLTKNLIDNLVTEVEVAKELAAGEKQKWNNGDSDYVLVNIREQDATKAEIEKLKAQLNYEKLWSEAMHLSMKFDSLL
ncbi:MAG: TolC family protein [Bdellovibrionales bacterium]|nr:TolC family protein [Bdellovibrionales bacterium]